jgi:hypothetical protein
VTPNLPRLSLLKAIATFHPVNLNEINGRSVSAEGPIHIDHSIHFVNCEFSTDCIFVFRGDDIKTIRFTNCALAHQLFFSGKNGRVFIDEDCRAIDSCQITFDGLKGKEAQIRCQGSIKDLSLRNSEIDTVLIVSIHTQTLHLIDSTFSKFRILGNTSCSVILFSVGIAARIKHFDASDSFFESLSPMPVSSESLSELLKLIRDVPRQREKVQCLLREAEFKLRLDHSLLRNLDYYLATPAVQKCFFRIAIAFPTLLAILLIGYWAANDFYAEFLSSIYPIIVVPILAAVFGRIRKVVFADREPSRFSLLTTAGVASVSLMIAIGITTCAPF